MPRIEEVQFVHWGSLRADPIPLLVDGINVATGPNGSGKTCFLDGLKLVLGVTDFTAGRTPAKYIFDGGTDGTPADKAYLRATFANPLAAGGRHRVFAWAGHGCEAAEHVTVACVVTGQERWYAPLPGRLPWGTGDTTLADDLAAVEALPRSRRLGPRKYDELLERAGVTKALRGVLALPQGATDRLVEQSPTGMLLRLLELTGKQHTREEFRAQREEYLKAKETHARTLERYRSEQRHLELLDQKATRHREWREKRDELTLHDDVLLPAARHRDLVASREELQAEVAARRNAVDVDERELAQLTEALPALRDEQQRCAQRQNDFTQELRDVRARRSDLDLRIGRLEEAHATAARELNEAAHLAADMSEADAEAALADAEEALRIAEREREQIAGRLRDLDDDIALLVAGRPVPPAELAPFVSMLADRDIPAQVVAERIDVSDDAPDVVGRAAEAALADALWAVVVPAKAFDDAVAAAIEAGHRWPVAAAGDGHPKKALAAVDHPTQLGALLEELDLPVAGEPDGNGTVVTGDGLRRGRLVARLAAPERSTLGRRARERRLEAARREVDEVGSRIAHLDARLPTLREDRRTAERRLDAVRALPALRARAEALAGELAAARTGLPELVAEEQRLDAERGTAAKRLGELERDIDNRDKRAVQIEDRLGGRRDALRQSSTRLAAVEEQLAGSVLTPAQHEALAAGRVFATDVVAHDRGRIASEVDDTARFPGDVRDVLIVHQRDEQATAVAHVDDLVSGHAEELDRQQLLVDEAARRYDEHIRAVVRLLNQEFARVCEAAGAAGEIRMVAGDRPDEQGVEVRVAHRAGEPRRSYRDPAHSGGQRAKIAILILLAAMGVGGEADLLVMDEHIAHLDSTNIDHIADLMRSLRHRVQFVLATPTNAEALRLGWCDLQLAFLPRSPGETYTPPLRIMTSAAAEALEQRFAAAQLTL